MPREEIRVLYYTDPTAFQIFGGAEIQMLKTKEYLDKMNDNIFVKFFDFFKDELDEYNILHIFQMRPECLSLCRLAKIKGLKIVLSPIYWPESETWKYASIIEKMLSKIRIFYSNFKGYNYLTFKKLYPYKDFLEAADIVVPNSRIEAEVLSKEFRINPSKFFPVPVGVEGIFANLKPDFFVKKYGLKDFVLFVGRIEQTKNVLTLLKAYSNIEIPLVIIGHFNLWEHEYFVKCKGLIEHNRNIHYLGFMPPYSKELLSAYAAAKVFVLPSWHEIPGLCALEAGLAGCNLVITDRGSTKEYFKDYAFYVNPTSVECIKKKILEAYEKPKDNKLKEHILKNYTWEKTAKRTLAAYDLALSQASQN
jgi:glycosyltransferase involved in cell wall biosynthesis